MTHESRTENAQPSYTALMTVPEAMRALGVLRRDHLLKLVNKHSRGHWPVALWADGIFPAYSLKGFADPVLRGAFVENLAICEQCRPALMAARSEGTEVGMMVALPPDHVLFNLDGEDAEEEFYDEGEEDDDG